MPESSKSAAVRNPFPGLRPFHSGEEHLFFGRERQVDRMIDKLAAHRFLAVVGTSGSGKSSLVNCGLRPGLHRGLMASAGSDWRMAQLRPGSDPIGALARALAVPGVLFASGEGVDVRGPIEATLRMGSLGLVDIVEQARLPEGTQLLIVVDQFEELFRFRSLVRDASGDPNAPGAVAVAFVRLLMEARAQSEVPIHIVLTMRSDFLGDCAQFRGLPEAINEGQYLVPRLTRDEIRAAISGPVGVAGATITPVLLTRLLNDVGDDLDQLSILQHALNRTWAYWERTPDNQAPLDLADYEAMGGMARALDLHAEKAFGELVDDRQRRLAERVFKALTDKGTDARGIRRPTRLGALCAIASATEAELKTMLEVFRKPSRSFVMPPAPEALSAESVIDISHEALMRVWERLKTWADEEAASAARYRRLRESAALHADGKAALWRDPELQLGLTWREQNEPTSAWAEQYGGGFEKAMSFLDSSRDELREERIATQLEQLWTTRGIWLPVSVAALAFLGGYKLVLVLFGDGRQNAHKFLGSSWQEVAGFLFAGLPAALLTFMVVAPPIKTAFRGFVSARLRRSASAVSAVTKPASPTPQVATDYASLLRRAAAELVDSSLCFALYFVVLMVLGGAGFLDSSDDAKGLLIMVLMLAVTWLYYALGWSSRRGATPGMRLTGIVLTDVQGAPLGFGRATARFFARFLCYYTLGLGLLMQPFSAKRQALHDRISGTLVLNTRIKRRASEPPVAALPSPAE